jgi:hypothetical protein
MKWYLLLVSSVLAVSCKRETHEAPVVNVEVKDTLADLDTLVTDTDTIYPEENEKYEYRLTRNDGKYQYDYEVEGTDVNGNTVNGEVQVAGKYGVGELIHPNLGTIKVETEWKGKGMLMAIDAQGNEYELAVK